MPTRAYQRQHETTQVTTRFKLGSVRMWPAQHTATPDRRIQVVRYETVLRLGY